MTFVTTTLRRMSADSIDEVREQALKIAHRGGEDVRLVSIYRVDLIPPREVPPGGAPPSGPPSGVPEVYKPQHTTAIARAA